MSLYMDQALSRRLERTEGAVGSSFPGVRQKLAPETGAVCQTFGGTYAIFDGASSPFNQTFGLGLFEPATDITLAAIEAFFEDRGADVMHEVSPLAGVDATALLAERGYRPIELSTVLVEELSARAEPPATAMRARMVTTADHDTWIDAAVAGWSNDAAGAELARRIAVTALANPMLSQFVVERDGAMIGTASMAIHDGVAMLIGASTVPAGRGLGAQGALLTARLDEARRHGCELAMIVADPGSTSQRNAERRGFRVAYSRIKWRLPRRRP